MSANHNPETKPTKTPVQQWLERPHFATETDPAKRARLQCYNILGHMNRVAEEQRRRDVGYSISPEDITQEMSDRDIAAYLAELAAAYSAAQSERFGLK